jgi:O-antigen/teichoic acid export membrane protein
VSDPSAGLDAHTLTRRGLLARNVVWNLLGVGLPLLVAVFAIPVLVRSLGEGRFGLLSLSWIFIGYFNIFDLGFGRALTKIVSSRIALSQQDSIPRLIATAMTSVMAFSLLVAVVIFISAPWLATTVMRIPEDLHAEAEGVLRVLALAIPFVILGTVLRGALESFQRFDLVNAVRVSSGLYLFLGPLFMLPFTHNMVLLIGMLALGKVFGTLMFLRMCFKRVPQLASRFGWTSAEFRSLFTYGGWITVGNILGPLLTYTDHFMIGALVSVAMVGYYIVPYQMVTKLWVIVTAIVGVLFPALSVNLISDPERARRLFATGVKAVIIVVAPAAWLLTAFSGEILELWLNSEYRQTAGPLLQLFAIGVFINSFSIVTLALVQAAGRPDWVPRLFMIEMPIYLPALYLSIERFGLQGAATVWISKIVIDFLFLMWAVQKLMPATRQAMIAAIPGVVLMAASFLPSFAGLSLTIRLAIAVVWLAGFGLLAWLRVLDQGERNWIKNRLTSARRSTAAG